MLVIPNHGAGAAKARIETARRHFPRIFFNAETTEAGRDALGWYHEKKANTAEIGGETILPGLNCRHRDV